MLRKALYFFLWVSVAACKEKPQDPEEHRSAVEAFAQRVTDEMNAGKINILDKHFDKGVFVGRVLNDSYWDEKMREAGDSSYKEQFRKKLLQDMTLGGMFLSGLNKQSFFAYDLAKIYRIDERWHTVFRIYANDAINYHDCLLRIDSSKVWIEDIYVMTMGKELSTIMKEGYISGMPLTGGDARYQDHIWLQTAKMLVQQGDFQEALAVFDSISPDFRKMKSMRLFRLQISANIPNEEYVRQLESYEKDFPKDAGTLLLRLDKNFMYGDFPEIIRDLDRLEAIYSKDVVIEYLRGNAYFGLDDCNTAAESYKYCLTNKPEWEEPFINWLRCLVRNNRYQQAITLIETYQDDFGLTPTYVQLMVSDFPNFTNSQLYRKWKDAQDNPLAGN